MDRILVTGANGFLGSNLVNKLVETGENVRALDLKFDNPNLLHSGFERIKGNILDPNILEKAFQDISHVYHCAGVVSYDTYEMRNLMYQVNHRGTRKILRASLKQGIEKLVHVSSTAALSTQGVYCFRNNDFIPDNENLTGKDTSRGMYTHELPYGFSKYLGEEAVLESVQEDHLNATIVSPSTIMGKGDYSHSSVGNIIAFLSKNPLPLTFPGHLSLVDVTDVVEGAILAMKKGAAGRKYILSDHQVSIQELTNEINQNLGKNSFSLKLPFWTYYPLEYTLTLKDQFFGRILKINRLYNTDLLFICYRSRLFDSARAKEELGWKPTKSFEDMIHESVDFYQRFVS